MYQGCLVSSTSVEGSTNDTPVSKSINAGLGRGFEGLMNHPPMIQMKGMKNPRMKQIIGRGDCRRAGRGGSRATSDSAE